MAPRDVDGFVDLADYAVLGDGRGAALIAVDGSVDWWGTPELDSPPLFAALLDPANGGDCRLAATDPAADVQRRYLPHTNQLETTITTGTGRVRILDSLNAGSAGALPWSELARRVDGLDGEVELEFTVRPGTGLGRWQPWLADGDRGPTIRAGDLMVGIRLPDQVSSRLVDRQLTVRFTAAAGERRTFGLVVSSRAPVFLAPVDSIDARIDTTTADWHRWVNQVAWTGAGREHVLRSALALKTLVMARTGAVAAAATTSLPERIGGPKNWDYRYAWIRDAAMTIDALAALGLQEEVHAAVAWLLGSIIRHGPDVHIFFTLEGDLTGDVQHPSVPGYRGSRPVQIGNRAADQVQLGVYGDLFATVSRWIRDGHVLDIRSARALVDLADRCADAWQQEDAGIWELQTNRHYTSSKMNCWRALNCAAQLADQGHLGGGARWRSEAGRVRAWVDEHCWSETKRAYTFYAGGDELDASVLLGAQMGYDTGPAMSSTIDAITTELGRDLLVYRYTGACDEEETFVACAFWRVHALALTGRLAEADTAMRHLELHVPNDLGLMSEMSRPRDHALLGNLPQALSHLAHVNAAVALRDIEREAGR